MMASTTTRPIKITKEVVLREYQDPVLTKEEKMAVFQKLRGSVKNVKLTLDEIKSDRLKRV